MQRTFLRVAGHISVLFGLFWIVVTTLGFVYLLSNGQSPALQSQAAVSLCNMFLDVWYNPALKIYNFVSAPANTATIFWCVAVLIVMLTFFVFGRKLIKYSNEDYDLKENINKIVVFVLLSFIILCFAIFSCVSAINMTAIMFVNLFALILIFLLPTIECIKVSKE